MPGRPRCRLTCPHAEEQSRGTLETKTATTSPAPCTHTPQEPVCVGGHSTKWTLLAFYLLINQQGRGPGLLAGSVLPPPQGTADPPQYCFLK